MAEQKRVRRTPEQIAADIDGQISKLEENIRGLEEKKIAACAEFDAKIAAVQEKAAKLAERKKEVLSPKKRKPGACKAGSEVRNEAGRNRGKAGHAPF